MKNIPIILIGIVILILGCKELEDELEESVPELADTYFFRGNGTATGTIDFNIDEGTLQAGSSGVDIIYDIRYSEFGPLNNFSITFKRKGDYNQTYHGWVSSEKEQITGYYQNMGQNLPFTATLENEIVYSQETQTDLNGEWNMRGSRNEKYILYLDNDSGYVDVVYEKHAISILATQTTGDLGAIEIIFERTGDDIFPNQTYYGWISSDKKQMSGYYTEPDNLEYSFYAYKK